jgi:filamentous hemagglutinin family protein
MNIQKFLVPIFVLTGTSMNASIVCAQTYQPSNRLPVADSTLGTQVVGNNNNFAITGGLTKGQNTFHSFQDFSVPTNGVATFANPVGNQSIITRVTGSLFSDINGTINTQGANFLLINPNGVVFGPGTQLNVGRVFAASTANGIDLADGTGRTLTFGVNGAGDGALLSIDPKVIFNVSRLNLGGGNGEIKNFGTLQTNNPSQYIGLVGGNVTLDAGKINAPGGRIELGGLSAPGSVEIATEGGSPRLIFPTGVDRSNLVLNNQARISVAGAGSGDIATNAHNIDLLGDSVVRAGVEENLGRAETVAGNINLNATGAIVVDNSVIANNVRTNSRGQAGNINIEANNLSLRKQGNVQAFVNGQGNAGNIQVKVAEVLDIADNFSGINSLVTKQAIGNAGNITTDIGSLSLKNGTTIVSVTNSKGNSGNVSIIAKGDVSLIGGTISTNNEGTGRAGNLNINTNSLSLQMASTLAASSFGQGDAGNVLVVAKNSVFLKDKNTNISASIEENGVGKGGNIDIRTASLSISNGAQLISAITGKGDGGKVSILAKDAVFTGKDTAIFTLVKSGKVGNSGNIDLNLDSLSITNGAQLLSSNFGQGNAGNINIKVVGVTDISGQEGILLSGVRSILGLGGTGSAGNINLDSGSFFLKDAAQIQSASLGKGNAGNIMIAVKNVASFSGNSALFSTIQTGGIGKAGNIDLNSTSLSITDGSQITASSNGIGDSGSINVKNVDSVFLSGFGSQIKNIISSGAIGNAGDININAGSVLLKDGAALITASNGQGDAGSITVRAKDTISLSGETSSFISSIERGAIGAGGNIDLQASSFSLMNGSLVVASNSGIGDAGSIKVKISGVADIMGTQKKFSGGISSAVLSPENPGNSGSIIIDSNSLYIRDGSNIVAANAGKGNAGKVSINASNLVSFSGTNNDNRGLYVSSIGEEGVAGDIVIIAPQVILEKGFRVDSSSVSGKGGNINIGSPLIAKIASDQRNTLGSFSTNLILLRNGSQISTNAEGTNKRGDDGGNITLKSNLIVAVPRENSDITANAIKGQGGNVSITSQGVLGTQFRPRQTSSSDITASSDFGQSGNISINTPGIDPGKDTSKLPSRPIDASKQITQRCSTTQEDNQFYVTGRGGHPSNTNELLSNDVVWLDPRNPRTQSIAKIQQIQKSPQPAVGWTFNDQGKVTLLAASNQGTVNSSRLACPNTITH